MSFSGPVSHLPSPVGGINFSQKMLKEKTFGQNHNVCILKTLMYMNYDQLNSWIRKMSFGQYFLAKPKCANIIDLEVCLGKSAHIVLYKAIKPQAKVRKNGRDTKLLAALNKNDFTQIASILASSVRTYWQDRKYMIHLLCESSIDQRVCNVNI